MKKLILALTLAALTFAPTPQAKPITMTQATKNTLSSVLFIIGLAGLIGNTAISVAAMIAAVGLTPISFAGLISFIVLHIKEKKHCDLCHCHVYRFCTNVRFPAC